MTYTKNREGYLIPSLSLPNQPNPYLNRYARLRLEYLEQNGYVTRPDKRYRSPLTLTEKGQETGRAIAGKIDRLVEDDQYFYIFQSRQMAVMIPKGSLLPANPERFAKVLAKETGKDWQRSKSLWGLNLKDLVQMGKDRFQRSAS